MTEACPLLEHIAGDLSSRLFAALVRWPVPLGPYLLLRLTESVVGLLSGEPIDLAPHVPEVRDEAAVAEAERWLETRTAIPPST